ncbi:hypothetical protein BJX70DRAFT_362473 [Aspergillus crustosus]
MLCWRSSFCFLLRTRTRACMVHIVMVIAVSVVGDTRMACTWLVVGIAESGVAVESRAVGLDSGLAMGCSCIALRGRSLWFLCMRMRCIQVVEVGQARYCRSLVSCRGMGGRHLGFQVAVRAVVSLVGYGYPYRNGCPRVQCLELPNGPVRQLLLLCGRCW